MKTRFLFCVLALAFLTASAAAADPVDLRGKKGVVDPNDLKNPKPASGKVVDPKDLKKHDPKEPPVKPKPVPKP